jgi:cytochrome c553
LKLLSRYTTFVCLLHLTVLASWLQAEDGQAMKLAKQFDRDIKPLVATYCGGCHGERREGDLDLIKFHSAADVSRSHGLWEMVKQRIEAAEMPPSDAQPQLTNEAREAIVAWINSFRRVEAERLAGDPGVVLARRLSNAEMDQTILELTGVDIRPTATFPVDPANAAGFDNSGESLTMSPALLNKYLEAARHVTDHLLLTPTGIRFAPHPVATDTDRDKYCVKRIVEFYQQQSTDYADYFYAAWKYQRDKQSTSVLEISQQHKVSPKYLEAVWGVLAGEPTTSGPLVELQRMWRELAEIAEPQLAQATSRQMRDYVAEVRQHYSPELKNLKIKGVHDGTQAFVLWKNRKYAVNRQQADFLNASRDPSFVAEGAESRARYEADCQKFCTIFPDAFYILERGRGYLGKRDEQEKGRLLSAGFHSMTGYFRDDAPLMELILNADGRRELDSLWQELNVIAAAPQRQYQGFLWFDRTDSSFMRDEEFDFARPEDKAALSQELIERLAKVFLAKAERAGGETIALEAIRVYFAEINQQIREVERVRLEAEPKQLQAVVQWAERAYRRPLAGNEAAELREFYAQLREGHLLTHEEAIQDTLVSILMSPKFCYRTDLVSRSSQAVPLDDYELASRLSYFLWSSMPDAELFRHASAGDLHIPEVLIAQVRRMLQDPRMRSLATEFAGNWLDFRRFEEHNSVDRQRFPSFDDSLRAAMFEEPIQFFLNVVQQDRSIMDFIASDRTFVNAALAKHYGVEGIEFAADEWREIDAAACGRGGLLPMAVFLTKNAPGLRTSPVKRGYWVVRRLLGERIPPPPPNVPELPADEAQLGERTLRETLAQHRQDASCAGCHNKIDSIGLVFEGFGPIGERRDVDLGGRAVDTRAEFPDGQQRTGIVELRKYLCEQRQAEFVSNFCRKLLSFGLGRSLQLQDEILLDTMNVNLRDNNFRIGQAIETIVLSQQFLNKRGENVNSSQTTALE